jgi:hypothetical protein
MLLEHRPLRLALILPASQDVDAGVRLGIMA